MTSTAAADVAGNFYIANSLVGVSTGLSTFKNCYNTYSGGAFTLVSTTLTDIGSTFKFNQANYGGVFNCDTCNINLK